MLKRVFLPAALGFSMLLLAGAASAGVPRGQIQHVLLISIDGMHALDVANYVKSHSGSAMAELAGKGVTFSNAHTPANSDSFPGMLALVTGGSPRSHGVFYDYSYDRTIWPPDDPTCAGLPGTQMIFDETIDVYDSSGVSQSRIDPNALPNYRDEQGQCARFYPHNAVRTNTVFEVIKAERLGRTAWADKHPAYDLVNGPSGHGVDDLYTPEVTNFNGFDNTVSVVCTVQNDYLKVRGVINEIQGKNHDGTPGPGVPEVFGMNFQAVSVGQKLSHDNGNGTCLSDTGALVGQPGGYTDGAGTPTAVLEYGLDKNDQALAMMIH